jgi:RNA polymerase sigma-70 factor (ECF subfamily)
VEKFKNQDINDQDLLEKYFQTRDNQWLGLLLERNNLLLFGVCMKHLRDPEEAREAVQQIQLKVIEEMRKYRVSFFRSWLYMVTVNHCNMQLRNRQRLVREITEMDGWVDPEGKNADSERDLRLEKLLPALEELKEAQRICLRLFYLEDKTYMDIARETKYSLKQVKSNIQNGKRNLKLILERDISTL